MAARQRAGTGTNTTSYQDLEGIPEHKLVLLGATSVGKSSIVLRVVRGEYNACAEPTIGAAYLTHVIHDPEEPDNSGTRLEIWDTAGQERYEALAPMYYRGASAALVVYDITVASTLDRAKKWCRELQGNAPSDCVVCLVGNKLDMDAQREIETEDAEAYATEQGFMFVECSAKENTNIDSMMISLARRMPIRETEKPPKRIEIPTETTPQSSKKKCC